MGFRVRFIAAVSVTALVAWLAAEWLGAQRGLGLRGLIVLGIATALAYAIAQRHARRLEAVRAALEGALAGAPRARLERSEPGVLGSLSRAVDAADAALRAQSAQATAERERFEAVLNGMVEGVLVLDADGRVGLANARLRELFQAWGEVSGRSPLEVIRRTDIDAALERAATSRESVAIEVVLGDERCLEMHARRFPDAGEAQGTVAVFHDVSEIRRLENHRRDFVANISHELRTPLTAIQGFAETLQDDSLEPERRRQYVDVIVRNAERLRALIEDLLELSRIEGGMHPLALEPVDSAALANSLLRDMGPRFDARKLSVSLSGNAPPVLADRRALEQVLQNLLDNAAKYTEPGGRIEVRVSSEPSKVRIEVADTGIGIPERDRARVFERFYRVDKARSRDLGGTGLGLSIVKHLAQAMDGDVFVTSSEGVGTTFSLSLPLAPPRGQETDPRWAAEHGRSGAAPTRRATEP